MSQFDLMSLYHQLCDKGGHKYAISVLAMSFHVPSWELEDHISRTPTDDHNDYNHVEHGLNNY